jgi:outer membrane protein assembly factor BamB
MSCTRRTFLLAAGAAGVASPQRVAWTQWGGPHRNFTTEASGLKSSWPAGGPKVIWKRPLGEGFSSASVEGNVLYTMYGVPGQEIVTAIDAGTGKTLWEHTTPVTFRNDFSEVGNGPYATPLLVGDRVFTTGSVGRLQCLDKKTGKELWNQMLWTTHGGTHMMFGYAASPIAFRDLVIVPVGAKGKATMAFRQTDGVVAWAKGGIPNAYSSPLLINLDGLEQLVQVMDGLVFGLNPHNGNLQWQIPSRRTTVLASQCRYGVPVISCSYRPNMAPDRR